MPEPVVYGVQGALREYYGAAEGPPIASTLDHIVAAVAGVNVRHAAPCPGRAQNRVRPRPATRPSVEGRIVGIGKTIRIASIHVHYDLAVPADAREATERALAAASSGGVPPIRASRTPLRSPGRPPSGPARRSLTVRSENG